MPNRRLLGIVWLALAHSLAAGCDGSSGLIDGVFTEAEMAKISKMGPLGPVKPDPTNKYADNLQVAAFGKQLFFDPGYSGPIKVGDDGLNGGLGAVGQSGKVSCRSCHLGLWLIDNRSQPNNTSLGIDWFFRNAPSLVNVAYYERQFGWVGFNNDLWGKNLIPAEFVMGTDRSGIVHYLYKAYKAQYNALFTPPLPDGLDPSHPDAARFPASATPIGGDGPAGQAWRAMRAEDQDAINRAYANFGKAIAAYERQLTSRNSQFDRYVGGDRSAMTTSAKRGLKLFIGKAACDACHNGPIFSDEKFHNTGVPQIGEHVLKGPDFDPGRYGAVEIQRAWDFRANGPYSDDPSVERDPLPPAGAIPAELRGAFRTKGIRSISFTGPFMHTGHLATLRDVVQFYNMGGGSSDFAGTKDPLLKPLNLSSAEIDDLVAFLESLTGDTIPAALLTPPAGM
ncbi:MAG TPA: cytochrome c peroxidase [Pseudomonadota bacterium]|nr:cytochrome c peroxidase [Pseudomonadota bacterium]